MCKFKKNQSYFGLRVFWIIIINQKKKEKNKIKNPDGVVWALWTDGWMEDGNFLSNIGLWSSV